MGVILLLCWVAVSPRGGWLFEEVSLEVQGYLASGLQPRTRIVYEKAFQPSLTRSSIMQREWETDLSERQRECVVAEFLVQSRRPNPECKLSKAEGGYLLSHLR